MKTKISWLPHGHRILVKVDEVEHKTIGGIVLPDTTVEKEQNQQVLATIIKVGPTAVVDSEIVKPGVRVMISKWGGCNLPGDLKLYRVINDEDINAVEVGNEN